MTTNATIVRHVAFGSQRVSRNIEPRARLDAGGTRLRLRALHVMGHGSARIARAPERTRAERAAAARARRRAAAGNWCAAAALNDHKLDTPGYRPRAGYRPATGTGVAPDIRLPVRRHYKRKGA